VRTAALIVGMFGGFLGVYFAQVLVTGTALFGIVASAFGGRNSEQPLYFGLVALGCYTLGIIGGALAIQRTGVAAPLMAFAAVGGAVATILVAPSSISAVTPQATSSFVIPTPRSLVTLTTPVPTPAPDARQTALYLGVPFGGAALLLLGAILAAASREVEIVEMAPTGRRRFVPTARGDETPTGDAAQATAAFAPSDVAGYRPFHFARTAKVSSRDGEHLLQAPGAFARSAGTVAHGVQVTLIGEASLYFYVRLADSLEGWLPKRAVRE
jgi:hypothetical protein